MKQFGLPQCPYCGKKINPFYAWYLRTQGEYICPACGGVSNIGLTGAAKVSGAVVAAIDLVVFVIAMLDQSHEPPFGYLIAMIVPFLLFTILSAFMVRLKKPVLKKREPPGNPNRAGGVPQRPGAQAPPRECGQTAREHATRTTARADESGFAIQTDPPAGVREPPI